MILCRLNEIGKIKMPDDVVTGVTRLANRLRRKTEIQMKTISKRSGKFLHFYDKYK